MFFVGMGQLAYAIFFLSNNVILRKGIFEGVLFYSVFRNVVNPINSCRSVFSLPVSCPAIFMTVSPRKSSIFGVEKQSFSGPICFCIHLSVVFFCVF